MPFLIRSAERADLEGIVAIYNHYVERSTATFDTAAVRTEDRVRWFDEHRASGPHRLLVAVDEGGRSIGWASTSPFRPRPAYATTVESSVYIDPDHRGQGVGRRLYSELFRSIAEEDLRRIVAGVTLPNPASLALHRQFGFRQIGVFTEVGRKFDRYWDVAWFERPLHLDPAGRVARRPVHRRSHRAAKRPQVAWA